LYDVAPVVLGVAADLSHIETKAKVTGFKKEDLAAALAGVDLVIIPAGVPRKPGMTRDDLFGINAGIVKTLIEGCATSCPKAMIAIISNPVNSTVPIASEVLKKHGVYNPKKLIGVTTLDIVRSNTFVGEKLGVDPVDVSVPVIGGHAGVTILPLLSQSVPPYHPTDEVRATLTKRIQNAGTEVVEAKAGAGSATLSMAYAGARMGVSILKGLSGRRVMECGFVQSTVVDGLPFFATQIALGPNGVEEVTGTGALNAFEQQKLEELKPGLKASIDKGIKFVTGN
jgi:malate dehydrogenase